MELTRRDALGALAASGVAVSGCLTGDSTDETATPAGDLTAGERETLVAAAEVLYPSAVSGIQPFVTTYVEGRIDGRPEHAAGVRDAIATLEEYARDWFDDSFTALDTADRDGLLGQMGLDTREPVPDGQPTERVRYYVVNELLFALYTSPTGGRLVGLENPMGHPGGQTSYRRGPDAATGGDDDG
jgi:hypothetical protein